MHHISCDTKHAKREHASTRGRDPKWSCSVCCLPCSTSDIAPLAHAALTTPACMRRSSYLTSGTNITLNTHPKTVASEHRLLTEIAFFADQIARQVEDPGLKHSSPTHVGLELSIRHAAEFFAFYVCRFVLADMGTLLDKFVKRGTEWVLA